MIGNSHKLEKEACLGCGYIMDRAAQFEGNNAPQGGDATVCIKCGHVMIFNDSLSFRNMTSDEQKEIEEDSRIQKLILAIRNIHQTVTH